MVYPYHGIVCSPWDSPGQNIEVGSHSLLLGIFPTQGSNPGLPHCRWILYQLSHQGSPRILEWVAYPFCRRSIFLTQELNRGVQSCRRILYQLSYQGSPSGMLLNNEKEWHIDTCSNLDESHGNCAAWKKSISKGCILYACFFI